MLNLCWYFWVRHLKEEKLTKSRNCKSFTIDWVLLERVLLPENRFAIINLLQTFRAILSFYNTVKLHEILLYCIRMYIRRSGVYFSWKQVSKKNKSLKEARKYVSRNICTDLVQIYKIFLQSYYAYHPVKFKWISSMFHKVSYFTIRVPTGHGSLIIKRTNLRPDRSSTDLIFFHTLVSNH